MYPFRALTLLFLSEVRRAALFNLIPSATTLPHLLRRTLDVDTTNRRLAFSHVLVEIPPRSLTKTQRREIMGRGLRDREEAVRKSAKKLVAKWLEQVDKDEGGEATIEAFVGFFDLFDEEGQKVAEKALEALFEVRPDLIQDVEFSGAFRALARSRLASADYRAMPQMTSTRRSPLRLPSSSAST